MGDSHHSHERKILRAKYYDYPEGQDYFGKMVYTNKLLGTFGFLHATADVFLITKPQSIFPMLARYAKFMIPALGVASAWTTGVYVATQLRGEADPISYLAGAIPAGGIVGRAFKNGSVGVAAGAVIGIFGLALYLSEKEKWGPAFVDQLPNSGSHRLATVDWSILSDPPKGYTTPWQDK